MPPSAVAELRYRRLCGYCACGPAYKRAGRSVTLGVTARSGHGASRLFSGCGVTSGRGWSVPDSVEMLVTGDPVVEIEAAPARAATRLRAARACEDSLAVQRLTALTGYRLD